MISRMRLGISSLIYERRYRKLAEYTKRLDKLYLSYIDSTVNFALKNGFATIEISGLVDDPRRTIVPVINQIKQKIDVFDEVVFHLPYSNASLVETKEAIGIAESLGIKLFVLHPNFSKGEAIDLITFCKERGLLLCLENMPLERTDHHKPEEFDYFIEKGGFLTLDTGHAIVCGVDPLIFVERFEDKIKHVHLQDAFRGKPDTHYAIGDGELDYANFLKKMREIGYDGIIMLELVSEGDVKLSMERIREHL